ncbi:MAG: hypothetical protein WDN75_00505 [Bacteroidota bacterium]
MYLPFESLPGHSRVWIYQADRTISASEKEQLSRGLTELCEQWSAHGTPLHTSFTIAFDRFVIMSVDELRQGASGCSIDGSVRYLKGLQSELGLDFFDRTRVAFLQNSNVVAYPLADLKSLFENGTLSAGTIAFNNLAGTKAEWEAHWQQPVSGSWMARYLPKTAVAG